MEGPTTAKNTGLWSLSTHEKQALGGFPSISLLKSERERERGPVHPW